MQRVKTGRRPYRIQFLPDGKTYLVTNWADGSLSQFQSSDNAAMATLRLGPHPTDMILRPGKNVSDDAGHNWLGRLFVAAANTNSVYSVGISENAALEQFGDHQHLAHAAPAARHDPYRAWPQRRLNRLYVACSDANAVAVADISQDRTHVIGFIPTGWYPTAVRGSAGWPRGIVNGKGLRSLPQSERPEPLKAPEPVHEGVRNDEYVGTIQRGTVGFVDAFDQTALSGYTQTVLANSPYRDAIAGRPATRRALRHQARDLHREGKPHLRSDAGRYERRQRRSLAGAVRRKNYAQST